MNITPHNDCWQEGVAPAGSMWIDARPDWRGLRARLGAAHAARRVLLEDARVLLRNGSFDRASAHALAAFGHGLPDVNPEASEVGNLPGANCGVAAGSPTAGGRG